MKSDTSEGAPNGRIKATLPAPYIIGRRMWHPEHSKAAYPTREKLMTDCVPILRQEIELLREAGADTIQLDEPWLSTMVDPDFREREGVTDVQYEMGQCVDFINQTLDGIEGVDTGMHLCHAHFDREHGTEGPLRPNHARVGKGAGRHNFDGICHASRGRIGIARPIS